MGATICGGGNHDPIQIDFADAVIRDVDGLRNAHLRMATLFPGDPASEALVRGKISVLLSLANSNSK